MVTNNVHNDIPSEQSEVNVLSAFGQSIHEIRYHIPSIQSF